MARPQSLRLRTATTSIKGYKELDDCQHTRHTASVTNASEGQTHMVAVLYHSRSLCYFSLAYDLGPQLRRHNIADSEVPLSLGCCRRSAARCVGQRAVPGPDLHCALPALSLSVCITAASIRTHCTTWPPHLHVASPHLHMAYAPYMYLRTCRSMNDKHSMQSTSKKSASVMTMI